MSVLNQARRSLSVESRPVFYLRLQLSQAFAYSFLWSSEVAKATATGTSAACARIQPTQPEDTQPRTFCKNRLLRATHDCSSATSVSRSLPAHAACLINLSASNFSPFFHTAKVIAAILRATVKRASSGRSPLPNNSA